MSKPPDDRQTFRLTIRPEPGDWSAPVIVRLRGVLKRLLRSYGFRCIEIVPAPPEPDGEDGPDATG